MNNWRKNRFKKLRKSFGYSINLDTFVLGQTKVLFVVYLLSSFYIQQAVALGKAAAYQFVFWQTDRPPKPSTPSPYGTAPEGHGERIPRPPSVASLRSSWLLSQPHYLSPLSWFARVPVGVSFSITSYVSAGGIQHAFNQVDNTSALA